VSTRCTHGLRGCNFMGCYAVPWQGTSDRPYPSFLNAIRKGDRPAAPLALGGVGRGLPIGPYRPLRPALVRPGGVTPPRSSTRRQDASPPRRPRPDTRPSCPAPSSWTFLTLLPAASCLRSGSLTDRGLIPGTESRGVLQAGTHCWPPIRHHGHLMRPAAHDQALNAVRQFHTEHGRLPQWLEWEHATPDRPCARTIERR
jgi:hypothetical protein